MVARTAFGDDDDAACTDMDAAESIGRPLGAGGILLRIDTPTAAGQAGPTPKKLGWAINSMHRHRISQFRIKRIHQAPNGYAFAAYIRCP
jgi:hypothetical protein